MRLKARPSNDCGRLPLPKGEGWGEGLQTTDRSEPPHPRPLPVGERESLRAVHQIRAHQLTNNICFASRHLFEMAMASIA